MDTNKKTQTLTLIVFILGIFMGAIDSGIVSPARTIIQNSFNVSENIGVWMITIYTLAYAVSMPIVSKLSDKFGMKKIYIISIIVFSIGSALCGLNNFYGNFNLFLISRVIQAIGGGGIIPIANAYIGQSFPPEKRGTALGMVGAVYGIATVLGPTLGSSILTFSGTSHWGWIFFINIPISIAILFLSGFIKEEISSEKHKNMDLKGSIVVSILILTLMYALTNLNFFKISESMKSITVWPYLIIFILFLPIFISIENKAEDPILNLYYFKNSEILKTLIISFIVGCGLMGIVFVPQFGENTLRIKSGNGGYLVTLMAVFSGISAPLGGSLIDRYSAKLVMSLGFSFTALGTLFLSLYTTSHTVFTAVFIGLAFVGLGMGFTMGTPLNYLMLSYVPKEESTSALSTLSLVRSIGVAVSPNIMVNFIADAGNKIPDKIKEVLPPIKLPNIGNTSTSNMDITKSMSPEMLEKFKTADITNIVAICKDFMSSLLDKILSNVKLPSKEMTVKIKSDYINSIESKRSIIENTFQNTLNIGFKYMFLTAAIIAIVGLLLTLLLKNKKSLH